MITKKRSAVFCSLLFILLIGGRVFAQPFEYIPTTTTFKFNLPTIQCEPGGPTPYYTLFVETGDGRYFRGTVLDATTDKIYTHGYDFPLKKGSRATATISGWYDTTPRPPRNISISVSKDNGPGVESLEDQKYLSKDSVIAIDPCVEVVVPGDTMAVAINYKPVAGSKNLVAFFYNKFDVGGNIFDAVNSNSTYNFNDNGRTMAIRIHNKEEIYTEADLTGVLVEKLPEEVRNHLSPADRGYTNAVYFLVSADADTKEKNIFLSLSPTRETGNYQNDQETFFEATLVKYNNSTFLGQVPTVKHLGIGLVARDPNGIDAGPKCLSGSSIPITVTFRNDGPGRARNIIAEVLIPEGVKFPTDLTSAYLYTKYGTQLFKPWFFGTTAKNYYNLDLSHRKITFTMNDINLPGTVLENVHIDTRRGTIGFRLGISPPLTTCMYFDVAIRFINENKTPNKFYAGWDVVKTNCIIAGGPCTRPSHVKPNTH